MTSICPSLPMHTCFMGLPSLLFSVHCQSFPIARRFIQQAFSYKFIIHSFKFPFHSDETIGFPPSRRAEFQPYICCCGRELPLFPVRLRSFRLGGKVMATDLGSPSSGRRRFAGKSPHSHEVVFSTKNLYSRPRSLSGAAETKRQRRQDRRKKNGKFSGSYI